MEISDLRKQQYEYLDKLYPYINDWMRYPYTLFKARFYMESSAILVYWCLRFGIRPNTVTMVYISCGIVGGVLLAIPMKITIYLSIFIFFSKGIGKCCPLRYPRHLRSNFKYRLFGGS